MITDTKKENKQKKWVIYKWVVYGDPHPISEWCLDIQKHTNESAGTYIKYHGQNILDYAY
jgi:hypothetical protein